MLKEHLESWVTSRNPVLKGTVNALSDSRKKPIKKVMAVDHMQNLAKANEFHNSHYDRSKSGDVPDCCSQQNGGRHLLKTSSRGPVKANEIPRANI